MSLRNAIGAFLRFFRIGRPRSALKLKRWTGSDRPPRLMWKDCHPRTRATFKAELTCSNGHSVSLRGHSIASDGRVSPSVVCRTTGCDFHDFVSLDGWSAGAL
jgi:hypothetical protein